MYLRFRQTVFFHFNSTFFFLHTNTDIVWPKCVWFLKSYHLKEQQQCIPFILIFFLPPCLISLFLKRCKSFFLTVSVLGLVGIVFSRFFYWFYIHCSGMYITHIKRNSWTLYVVSIYRRVKLQSVFFSQNDEKHDKGFWK